MASRFGASDRDGSNDSRSGMGCPTADCNGGVLPMNDDGVDEFPTVYRASDGRYYTGYEVGRKVYDGQWTPCLWERETGRQLVGTAEGELLMLVDVDPDALPEWVELREVDDGLQVVDTRDPLPPPHGDRRERP